MYCFFRLCFSACRPTRICYPRLAILSTRAVWNAVPTTCFFNSSGTTFFYLANSRPKRSVSLVIMGEKCSGFRSFWLFRKYVFSSGNFGSTEFLGVRVFKSTMKLNSTSLRFSSASEFTVFALRSWGSSGCWELFFQPCRNLSTVRQRNWLSGVLIHFRRCLTRYRWILVGSIFYLCMPLVRWTRNIHRPICSFPCS